MVEKRQQKTASKLQTLQSRQTISSFQASQTASGSGSSTGTSQTTSQGSQSLTASSTPTISANAPPGSLIVTQPPQFSTSYYKIVQGDTITFAWKFTNLIVTPTHLTISAVCEDGNTYPVGPTNGIIPGSATSVLWDAYAYQTSNPQLPLAQANYTLEIWGDQGPSAQPAPGYLASNNAVHFALYTAGSYTPLSSGQTCPGCSGAISQHVAHPAFVGLIVTLFVMFLSGTFVIRRG
ncbi:hypothetical protein JVU11DRAFT_8038 [Chiua virens]|nr:hypothetical protein JVU11DRAFT_8038 [Chiua virens]